MTRILVVEDDPAIALGLEDDLTLEGYTVEVVRNGEAALARLGNGGIDLVLLDVMLPRKDGFAVCRELRKDPKFRRTCIILASGQTESLTREKAKEVGADFCLPKPYDVKQLMGLISGRHGRA